MTICVTGATGFVGGTVARQLRSGGHRVRAIVRSPKAAGSLAAAGVELHEGDVANKESLRLPMSGAEAVFHIAGWYKIGIKDRDAAVRTNVDGTRNVLELMHKLGIPKGVYTSTLAVNSDTHGRLVDETFRFTGSHLSVYDETKAEAHRIAEAFITRGLPLVIVQPGLVYGPGDTSGVRTTLRQFLQRKLPLLPRETAFAWGHIEDVARGHVLAMERGTAGRNYFLAGPAHTLVEAIDVASDITGVSAPRLRVSPGVLGAAAACAGVLERFVTLPSAYASESLRVLAGVTYIGSSARAQQELGWTARPLREGLTETLRVEMGLLGMATTF
jgi:nucleoside-diphosphate-sugar epimerase